VARVRRRAAAPEFDPAPGAGDVLWLRTPDLPAGGLFADEPFGTAGVAPAPDPRGYAATPAGAPALAWDDEAARTRRRRAQRARPRPHSTRSPFRRSRSSGAPT
jgi:hypothetical protein